MMNTFEKNSPKSPLALYVKIYCKKRGKNNKGNNISEAMKSWLSLSEPDKQQFLKKTNEYKNNMKMAYAYYLKNAEPYLKVKKKKKEHKRNMTVIENYEESIHMNIDQIQSNQFDLADQNNIDVNATIISHNGSDIQLPGDSSCLEESKQSLTEPTPPQLITGKQLFKMINENKECDINWATLTNAQKRVYQNAVLDIKRKYLKDYKNYLEQLPSEKLYYHFKKNYNQTFVY